MSSRKPSLPAAPPKHLTDVITPMLTPCHEDRSIDHDGVRNLIRWLKSRKVVRSVFVRSGTGGMWTLSVEETKRLIETTVEEAAGEIGILANCSGEFKGKLAERPDPKRYLDQSIELAAYARDHGADAAVLVLPYPLAPKPGQAMEDLVFDYYKTVADAVDHPIFIYQTPGMPDEYHATAQLMRRLVSLPQICGIKVSTDKHDVFDPVAEGVKDAPHFALIAGSEFFMLEALKLGAVGVLGGGATTQPELLYAAKWHYDRGNLERAAEVQLEVTACEKAVSSLGPFSGSVRMVLLGQMGYPMGPYTRGRTVYGAGGGALPRRMDLFVEAARQIIELFAGPYREAVQAGRDMP